MSKYWCKCGRVVSKSTNATTTGNRDTADCEGCPYRIPWGPNVWTDSGFKLDVQGYECRMTSHPVDYVSSACGPGGPNDKTVLHVESLDFDFLQTITDWAHESFPGVELSGGFNREHLRGVEFSDGYRVAFYPSANKRGAAAKQQLFHRFFHSDGTRLDMTPEEEKAKVLADIEKGKAAVAAKEKEVPMKETVYKDAKGVLYRVGETGELGNADRCRLTIQQLGTTPGAQWRKKSMAPNWSMAARKDAMQALEIMAEENGWKEATEAEVQYNLTERAALLDDNPYVTALYSLDLSERTIRCLERAGIDTVEELAAMSDEEIMRIRDMGRSGMDEIQRELKEWKSKTNPPAVSTEPEGDQEEDSLQSLGLSEQVIGYLEDAGVDTAEELEGLLECEKEDIRSMNPADMEKISAYLQKDNPTPADDLPWSAAATAVVAEPAESPAPAALTPTTETAVSTSASAESAAAPVPASSNTPTAFDYSGLDEQTVVDLHLAEHEYTHGKKLAEMGLRRMADGVAIAHDALCGSVVHLVDNSKHGNRGEESFRAWCVSMGIGKTTAYKMLQVADAFMASSPNQQKVMEQLPSTLLYDFAKPATPENVKKQIIAGDISSHKEYQAAMARIKQLEQDAELDHKERDDAYAKADKYRAEASRRAQDQQRLEGLVDTRTRERDAAIQDARRAKAEQENSERLADDEIARVQHIADDANDRAEAAEARARELESRPIEVTGANAVDIARWREEGAAQARQEQVDIIADLQDQVEDAKNAQGNVVDALYRMAEQIAASCAAQLENWSKAAACLEPDAYMDCVQQFDSLRIQILHLLMEGADDE